MTNRRDIENEIEELADAIDADDTDDDEPQTKAEAGITADFIRGANEEPQELAEGWTWERREDDGEHGASYMTAVREGDAGEGDDPDGPDGTPSNTVEEDGATFVAFTENAEDDR